MAIKTIYIGSWGPLKYDDQDDVNDPDGLFAGLKQKTIVTDGPIEASVVSTILIGNGNPTGGTVGQLLRKKSSTDYDVEWSRKLGGDTHYSEFETDGTLVMNGDATVWDDLRILIGNLTRPGASDPTWVSYAPNGGGISTYLLEFAKNNWATFTVQMPHNYKAGSDIYIHIHWTPGTRGNEENGNTVGWKIEYSWANINDNFGNMVSLDLSDACDGTDHKHQMTPDVQVSGSGMGISSMLLCNVKRSDTGTDDTWSSTTTGQLPMLTEVDIHYEIDTIGSRQRTAK